MRRPGPQPVVQSMKIEVEADGLPAQLAPRQRPQQPDDPSEPWSPNYGTVLPGNADRPLDTSRLAQKLDVGGEPKPYAPHARPMNAEDIIRQAIAAHEMRRN
jgi:hypothetical protein